MFFFIAKDINTIKNLFSFSAFEDLRPGKCSDKSRSVQDETWEKGVTENYGTNLLGQPRTHS